MPGPTAADRARALWHARRGMRELDLLLLPFVRDQAARLDAVGFAALERLLERPDEVLLEWLMGRQLPTDPDLERLVQRIRAAVPA